MAALITSHDVLFGILDDIDGDDFTCKKSIHHVAISQYFAMGIELGSFRRLRERSVRGSCQIDGSLEIVTHALAVTGL